jgi:hypothetical protein
MKSTIPTITELKKTGSCPICGYVYDQDAVLRYYAPTHGAAHRYSHWQHAPEPDPRLAALPPGDIRADCGSPSRLRKLVNERAPYLRCEEGCCDEFAWHSYGRPVERIHALLLVEPPHVPVGARRGESHRTAAECALSPAI